jgi:hypothetical protein
MKGYNILLLIAIFVIGFVCGLCFDIPHANFKHNSSINIEWSEAKKDSIIDAYEWYFISVEELLDTLENHYNWIDGIDSYEYSYWINKLDSLYNE